MRLGALALVAFGGFVCTPAAAQVTERESVASDGTQGNFASVAPALSADGRFVAFESVPTNLVPGDTNGFGDVFVHDRMTGTTERVSVALDGTQGNARSLSPAISADGRFVAFASTASNLVAGDTNGRQDVFVRDRMTGTTERVSVASDGTQGNASSYTPALSADGRFVAFDSDADNLVPGDTNASTDVFVHDRMTGTTERVTVTSNGTQGNSDSFTPALSADGRFVTFESDADNLVPGDTNGSTDVFVHDRLTGTTKRVSVTSDGTQGNGGSDFPVLSADGRFVAFESDAHNLVPGDTNGFTDVFVHDRLTGTTERVSVASDGTQGDSASVHPAISADGGIVAFNSAATNLVPSDTNAAVDVFVRVRTSPTTTTTLPCTSARCTLQSAETSAACGGQAIPAGVIAKLTKAENLIDRAASNSGKNARGLLERAKMALKTAEAKATRATKGKKPKISSDCAAALKGAAERVMAGLGV